MKIRILCLYFGKLPTHFSYFLRSCTLNPLFDWLIITDDETVQQSLPKNIIIEHRSFESIQKKIQSKFAFKISLEFPRKLCDYKPAYGYIFEEFFVGYDFWGYCDIDIIFGKLSRFIDEKLLKKYDKIFTLGHLSLIRNDPLVNKRFMAPVVCSDQVYHMPFTYKDIFMLPVNCIFDENSILIDIHRIYDALKIPYYDNRRIITNISPYKPHFTLFKYYDHHIRNLIYLWQNGHLYMKYICKNQLRIREVLYVHIEKRQIPVDYCDPVYSDSFIITPDIFRRDYLKLTKKQVIIYSQNSSEYNYGGQDNIIENCKLTKECWKIYLRNRSE